MTNQASDSALMLQPVEQRQVDFYDDTLIGVRVENGEVYVPIKPICDLLGVDWSGQRRRIKRETVLDESVRQVAVTAQEGERTITRDVACLPLDMISGFLFGISEKRVKPELKDRVVRYKRECYKVLAEAFREGRLLGAASAEPPLITAASSEAAQAYEIARAVMKLAEHQMMLESRVDDHHRRLDRLEAALGASDRFVSAEQASQISQAVKTPSPTRSPSAAVATNTAASTANCTVASASPATNSFPPSSFKKR